MTQIQTIAGIAAVTLIASIAGQRALHGTAAPTKDACTLNLGFQDDWFVERTALTVLLQQLRKAPHTPVQMEWEETQNGHPSPRSLRFDPASRRLVTYFEGCSVTFAPITIEGIQFALSNPAQSSFAGASVWARLHQTPAPSVRRAMIERNRGNR